MSKRSESDAISFYTERIVFYINNLRAAYKRINSLEKENALLREELSKFKKVNAA